MIGIKVSEVIQIAWKEGWIQVSNCLPLNEPYSPCHRASGQQQACQAEAEHAAEGDCVEQGACIISRPGLHPYSSTSLNQTNLSPLWRRQDRGGSQSWRLRQRKGNLLLKGKTVPFKELWGKTSSLAEGKLKTCILTWFRSLQLFISLGNSLHLESEGSKPVSPTFRLRQINTMKYFYIRTLFISTSKSCCWFED